MLRREWLVVVTGVLIVVAGSWVWLLLGTGTGMTPIGMTRMAGMDGWLMEPAEWSAGYALLMFSMWWIMMVAMMLPSAASMLLLFARVNGRQGSATSTGLFAAGYLLIWGCFSAVAVALQWALESAGLLFAYAGHKHCMAGSCPSSSSSSGIGQGQEPSAIATATSPSNSRRFRKGWESARGRMLGLQAIPSPLYRATVARLPKRLPVPDVANHLVCSVCGAATRWRKRIV